MNLQDFANLLRTRWITVCASVLVVVLGALAYSFATTPQYEAATRLFVSTSSGASVSDLYQGTLFSQERVLSYTELLMGRTVAERTIDQLGLDMSAEALQAKVKATAKPDTVLISVSVRDKSPVRARDIANVLSDQFVLLVSRLETPPEGGAKPDARVIVEERASVPTYPVVPNTGRNLLLGVCGGLLLGIGLAVVRDRLDNTVKDRNTVEEITGVGLVGSIPLVKHRRKEPAITFESDNSRIAEEFRKLRTNLQFLAVDNPPRVIVITSSSPNEGKSTTAINIALALAEANHDVVLVDGDLRSPSVHEYLDLVGTAGFSTVLSGQASLSQVLQKTNVPKLSVLTAGSSPPNPSELLGSLAAQKVLTELRQHFEYVIIDSSPLLAVTDGAILSANADGALVMLKYAETKRQSLAQAIGNLTDVGATVLGAVFTMTPRSAERGYATSYYSYGEKLVDSGSESSKKQLRFPIRKG